jgi:acyl-CoA thioester hydrolase
MKSHETRLRARYAETDQMGVVYYANYLVWMEVGRVEYCRAVGFRYRDLETEHSVGLAVAEANCRYLYPATYDEEVVVKTSVTELGSRLIKFEYEMTSGESGRTLARGYTKHIFVGKDMRPSKLPEQYLPLFEQ